MKKFKPIKINVPAEIDPYEVVRDLSHEELREFILQMDLSVADAGFTYELIMDLVKSLKGDLLDIEKEELINKIHNFLKE